MGESLRVEGVSGHRGVACASERNLKASKSPSNCPPAIKGASSDFQRPVDSQGSYLRIPGPKVSVSRFHRSVLTLLLGVSLGKSGSLICTSLFPWPQDPGPFVSTPAAHPPIVPCRCSHTISLCPYCLSLDGTLALPSTAHSLPGNGTRLTRRRQGPASVALTKEAGAVFLEQIL